MSTALARQPLDAAPSREAVMAQATQENFPVAMRLLGTRRRAHLLAIYGFARLADDIGDEASGDRGALLDWLTEELDRVYAGGRPEHPAMRRLALTVSDCALPREPFARLIAANRQDQQVTRYGTFDELLDYCQLSAAPVGELVLGVFDCATPERIALSDRVCAGLQVTEHLQDVAEDYARGRVYVPAEDLRRFGVAEEDLRIQGSTGRELSGLMAFQIRRAGELLDQGAPLVRRLPPLPGLAVAGFVAGGRAALRALEGGRPRAGRAAFASALGRTLIGARG